MRIPLVCLVLFGIVYSSVGLPLTYKGHRLRSLFQKHFDDSTSCEVCKTLVGILHGIGSVGIGEKELVQIATVICNKLKIEDSKICDDITHEFGDEVWYVFVDAFLDPKRVCGWVIGESCEHFVDYYSPWNVTIPPRRKEIIAQPWPKEVAI